MIRFFSVSMLLAALLCCAAGQITKSGAAYKLRVGYRKGQIIRFKTVSSVGNKQSSVAGIELTIPVTLKVVDFKQNVATVKLTMGAVIVEGQLVQPEQSTTFPLDNRNRGPVNLKQSIGSPLPEKSVHLGDTWKADMPVNIGGTTEYLQGVYRFAGLKLTSGQYVGVVTYTLSGPVSGSGTMMMLAKDGTLFSNETRLSMTGGNRLTQIVSKMTRL